MTYEEVIEQLDSLIDNSRSFHEDEYDVWARDIEAREVAKSAVEKQMPKKPEGDFQAIFFICICPICKTVIPMNEPYCFKCGQAIDWGDER